jgi:hypothetical protein
LNQKNLVRLFVAGATLASSAVMFAAKPAQAATFSVNGTDYDITTVTGTYNQFFEDSLTIQVQSTPWWRYPSLATQFANVVGTDLGVNVLFMVGTYGVPATGIVVQDSSVLYGLTTSRTFAVGSVAAPTSAVPEPLTILASITAAGFGVAFKRKKNSNKEE